MRDIRLNEKLTSTEYTRLTFSNDYNADFYVNFTRQPGAVESFTSPVAEGEMSRTKYTVKKLSGGVWLVTGKTTVDA